MVWRPPRSSGIVKGASSLPSAPMFSVPNSVSFGAKPFPETRLPSHVPQMRETDVLGGRPLAFSDARVSTGPCVGAIEILAFSPSASAAGTGCFCYGLAYSVGAPRSRAFSLRVRGRYRLLLIRFGVCSVRCTSRCDAKHEAGPGQVRVRRLLVIQVALAHISRVDADVMIANRSARPESRNRAAARIGR